MIKPISVTAINCEDGHRRHFASINETCRKLGMADTYAGRRVNDGRPCKGWLLFDDDHATSPEAVEAQRLHVKGYETKMQARRAKKDAFVSVRIDSRTTILAKAMEIEAAAEVEVDASKELKALAKAGHLYKQESEQIEKLMVQSKADDGCQGESTLWKLTQAITAHAREAEPRRQRELHEISGQLLSKALRK